MDNRGVASLWIGGPLSLLDQVCMLSYVKHGYEVTLFHYFPLENVPDGIITADAREIYADDDILIHRNGSPAMHADIFRLNLLKKTDMIWVDTDQLCLKPFDPDRSHIIPYFDGNNLTNCVLSLTQASPALDFMFEFVKDRFPIPPWVKRSVRIELNAAKREGRPIPVTEQKFTTFGPSLLKYAVKQSNEIAHAEPSHVYLPLPSTQHRFIAKAKFTDEILNDMIKPETRGMHLWSTNVRKNGWLEKVEAGSFLALQADDVGIDLNT